MVEWHKEVAKISTSDTLAAGSQARPSTEFASVTVPGPTVTCAVGPWAHS